MFFLPGINRKKVFISKSIGTLTANAAAAAVGSGFLWKNTFKKEMLKG